MCIRDSVVIRTIGNSYAVLTGARSDTTQCCHVGKPNHCHCVHPNRSGKPNVNNNNYALTVTLQDTINLRVLLFIFFIFSPHSLFHYLLSLLRLLQIVGSRIQRSHAYHRFFIVNPPHSQCDISFIYWLNATLISSNISLLYVIPEFFYNLLQMLSSLLSLIHISFFKVF